MVPFGVVMRDELRQGAAEVALANEDQAIQALFFDRANEALRVGVGVSCRLHRQRAVRPKPFGSRTHSIRCEAASSS